MTVPEMRDRMAEASPRFKARMAGVFQLLEALTATFPGLFVLGRLVVSGSGAATAANIPGHERLFRLGSRPRSSGLRAISLGRFSCMSCLNL
jgi:hypothetical protein